MRGIIVTVGVGLIVVIVAGFLIGSIVQIKTAAPRIQCANNLRQLGLALANYGDIWSNFPTAAMEQPRFEPEQRLSWLVSLTPYIESDNFYPKMDKEKGWEADENRFAALMRMSIFHCPGYPTREPDSTYFATHYLGVSGVGADAVRLPGGDVNAGFFGYARQLPHVDVQARGPTLMAITETCWASGAWTAAGPPTVRGLPDDGSPYLGRDGQFGGNHRGGLNVTFADGSVRFVTESIDPRVLEALVRIKDDGNHIRLEDY